MLQALAKQGIPEPVEVQQLPDDPKDANKKAMSELIDATRLHNRKWRAAEAARQKAEEERDAARRELEKLSRRNRPPPPMPRYDGAVVWTEPERGRKNGQLHHF